MTFLAALPGRKLEVGRGAAQLGELSRGLAFDELARAAVESFGFLRDSVHLHGLADEVVVEVKRLFHADLNRLFVCMGQRGVELTFEPSSGFGPFRKAGQAVVDQGTRAAFS